MACWPLLSKTTYLVPPLKSENRNTQPSEKKYLKSNHHIENNSSNNCCIITKRCLHFSYIIIMFSYIVTCMKWYVYSGPSVPPTHRKGTFTIRWKTSLSCCTRVNYQFIQVEFGDLSEIFLHFATTITRSLEFFQILKYKQTFTHKDWYENAIKWVLSPTQKSTLAK